MHVAVLNDKCHAEQDIFEKFWNLMRDWRILTFYILKKKSKDSLDNPTHFRSITLSSVYKEKEINNESYILF